jgi:hypothetical protein
LYVVLLVLMKHLAQLLLCQVLKWGNGAAVGWTAASPPCTTLATRSWVLLVVGMCSGPAAAAVVNSGAGFC